MRDAIVTAKLKPEPIEWLWKKNIPKGMICLVAGRPDQGKGLFAAYVASEISRQGGNVLYSAAEDDPARITRPRLEAAGADLNRVLVWQFRLPRQIQAMSERIKANDIKLVVMDPLASHLSGGVSRHSDNVRSVAEPMRELCDETGVTFLIVDHALKRVSKYADPIAMIGGSGSGMPAFARAAYLFGKDPKDPDRRLLAPVKLNIAEWPKTQAFELDLDDTEHIDNVPLLVHTEETDEQAGLLLDQARGNQTPGRPPSKRAESAEWLARYLYDAKKPVAAGTVMEDARQRGMTVKTLKRAALDMGIVKNPPGGGRKCKWSLPEPVQKMLDAESNPKAKGGKK